MLRPLDVERLLAGSARSDEVTEAVLHAALEEFVEFGLARSSMSAVARRAGVSRMTAHRRFAGKEELAAAVFLHQIRGILTELGAVMARPGSTHDRLVDGMAFGIPRVAHDELFRRLLQTDPESMLPYLTSQAGALVAACTAYLADVIGADDPRADDVAEALIRLGHSILLTPAGRFDLADPDELRHFLDRFVTALLAAPA